MSQQLGRSAGRTVENHRPADGVYTGHNLPVKSGRQLPSHKLRPMYRQVNASFRMGRKPGVASMEETSKAHVNLLSKPGPSTGPARHLFEVQASTRPVADATASYAHHCGSTRPA